MARTRDSRTSQCFFSSSSRTESFGHFRSHLNKQEPPPPSRSSLVLLCLFFTRHGRPYSCTALWATLWFLCSMSLRNTTTRRREKASALSNAPLMSFNCWRESRERERRTFGRGKRLLVSSIHSLSETCLIIFQLQVLSSQTAPSPPLRISWRAGSSWRRGGKVKSKSG